MARAAPVGGPCGPSPWTCFGKLLASRDDGRVRRPTHPTGAWAYARGVRKLEAAFGSAVFLVAAPGLVAGLVPWLLTGWRSSDPPALVAAVGGALIAIGAGVVLHAFARFVVEGHGTPAPIAPTERLVVGGLYRHVRNPMYVAVGATIVGQALLLGRPMLLAYAAAFWLVVAGFVCRYEEPTLTARYGEQYAAYRHAVPAWWPRLRPWSPRPPQR
jgi:protein-S-isoprenylcysteine O-methyltransferase Ste14